MMEQLKKEGKSNWKETERRIFSPVGLNNGAETPDEIALSIVTEIVAVHHNKNLWISER